ncbi:MAG: PAS domain S-box protein, partial [Phycisphaerae bacterium]
MAGTNMQRWWVRYGLAVAAVGVAHLARASLVRLVGDLPPYITFLPAVTLAALLLGLGPGLLVTAVAVLTVWFGNLSPPDAPRTLTRSDGAGLILFALMGTVISVVVDLYHRTRHRAAELAQELADRSISELKQAQVMLRSTEARLTTIVENLDEGLVVSDLNGQLLHWNPAALRMHGYADLTECLLGVKEFTRVFELSELDGTIVPFDQWPLLRILRGERLRDWELRVRRLNTDWQRIYSYGGMLIPDASGEPMLAVVRITDITERKRAEQALVAAKQAAERAQAVAESANRAKDDFLAVLSHELRTPITPALMISRELESRADLPESIRQDLKVMRQSLLLEARLIDDLLDLTAVAQRKLRLRLERVDVHELLRHALHTCSDEQFAEKRLEVRWELSSSSPTVSADPARLEQVFWNLLRNAIKFTPPGGTITIGTTDVEGGRIQVQVRDTGVGIDPSMLGG